MWGSKEDVEGWDTCNPDLGTDWFLRALMMDRSGLHVMLFFLLGAHQELSRGWDKIIC